MFLFSFNFAELFSHKGLGRKQRRKKPNQKSGKLFFFLKIIFIFSWPFFYHLFPAALEVASSRRKTKTSSSCREAAAGQAGAARPARPVAAGRWGLAAE